MARVRVRGIAATAITKLLLDKGHSIVQASRVIQERFGIPFDPAPADVTVKDGDADELVIIGFPREAETVLNDIISEIKYVFKWRPQLNLYSVVVGKVLDVVGSKCVVELPFNSRGILEKCGNKKPGELVTVSIIKPAVKPGEKIFLSRTIRVVGECVSLIYGNHRLSISEHIRDPSKRRELLALAASAILGKGFGIHLRSSSAYASNEDIINEIKVLENRLKEIINRSLEVSEPTVIYDGELVSVIGLTSSAKQELDHLRNTVIPTVMHHHSYKTYGGTLSDLVDYTEFLLDTCPRNVVSEKLMEYIVSKLCRQKIVKIIHVKPDGSRISLTPGKVESIEEMNGNYLIKLRRVFRRKGLFDGLGIEKNPGDYDEMIIATGKWYVIHNYHRSSGDYIGTYININTPPEILPDQIKYHDLAVDVVIMPNGEVKVVDLDELDNYREKGIVSPALFNKVKEVIEEARNYRYKEGQ